MNDILRVIWINLDSLDLWPDATAETWLAIAEKCPFPHYLPLYEQNNATNEETRKSMIKVLKLRLSRLASMKVNNSPLRLGTDWKGF
jgi:hypothetical protein